MTYYLGFVKLLSFAIGQPSPIECLQTVIFFLENLSTMINNLRIFSQLQVGLRKVQPQYIQQLLYFRSMLILDKINPLLVISHSSIVISFLQLVVSVLFASLCLCQFLLIAVLPQFLLLVLEIYQFDVEIESGVGGNGGRGASLSICVVGGTD